jgi:hypothetical protein
MNNLVQTVDIPVLCKGDVNQSYNPLNAKTPPVVAIEESGMLTVNLDQEILIPVTIAQNAEVGAISLVLGYAAGQAEIVDVTMDGSLGGKLVYNVVNDELRISWYKVGGVSMINAETMLWIKLRIHGNINDEAMFEALSGCEISDASGMVSFVNLTMPKLRLATDQFMHTVYPNPFSQTTNFVLHTTADAMVDVVLFDLLGQKVMQLADGVNLPAGTHTIECNASDLPQGIYQYRILVRESNREIIKTGKLILEN